MGNTIPEIKKLIETNAAEIRYKEQKIADTNLDINWHKGRATGLDEALTIIKKGGD